MSYLLSHNTVCKHSPLTYPHASEHIQVTLGNRARFTSIRKPVCYVTPHVDFIELPVEWQEVAILPQFIFTILRWLESTLHQIYIRRVDHPFYLLQQYCPEWHCQADQQTFHHLLLFLVVLFYHVLLILSEFLQHPLVLQIYHKLIHE